MSYDVRHFEEGIGREKIVEVESNPDDTNSKEIITFRYYYNDGTGDISDDDLIRIKKLGIPPAWDNLWVSRDPNSPIQAIGTDDRGRKQYRYHENHIKNATEEKFNRMNDFIAVMSKLKRQLNKDVKLDYFEKNKIMAIMVMLIQEYHFRNGKEEYARENESYGISSLRKKHLKIKKDPKTNNEYAQLKFKGKSNQMLEFKIKEPLFVEALKKLLTLQGDRLFQYEDDNGKIKHINYMDLNRYLQSIIGDEFSIKDFRTFAANITYITILMKLTKKHKPSTRKVIKSNLKEATIKTAEKLKHTASVSKKSYVMNFVMELYQNEPEFFIDRVNKDPLDILLELIELYKKR